MQADNASGPQSGKGTAWVIGQIVLLAGVVLVPPQIGNLPTLSGALYVVSLIAGLLIGAAGLGIVGLSALFLGTNLSIFPKPKDDGTLTQTGLYALVRHPMYSGVLLCALGWSLFRASLPSLLLTIVVAVFFDRKARREEMWLMQKYPDYGEYRRHVRKLIPWIY